MTKTVDTYTISYNHPQTKKRVIEAYPTFSMARDRALEVLKAKIQERSIYKVSEEQVVRDRTIDYRIAAHVYPKRYSITIKGHYSKNYNTKSNPLVNAISNACPTEDLLPNSTTTSTPNGSIGGRMVRRMIEAYEENN